MTGRNRQRLIGDEEKIDSSATGDGAIDYATHAVRDNPDMRKWFEDTYQCKWEDGGAQAKLHFAMGYAASTRHQRGDQPQGIDQ